MLEHPSRIRRLYGCGVVRHHFHPAAETRGMRHSARLRGGLCRHRRLAERRTPGQSRLWIHLLRIRHHRPHRTGHCEPAGRPCGKQFQVGSYLELGRHPSSGHLAYSAPRAYRKPVCQRRTRPRKGQRRNRRKGPPQRHEKRRRPGFDLKPRGPYRGPERSPCRRTQ